jgi:hypothetical protein
MEEKIFENLQERSHPLFGNPSSMRGGRRAKDDCK